jgi:hypothetical protein
MRTILAVSLAAVTIGFCIQQSRAAPTATARPIATPFVHLAQDSYWGGYYDGRYRPACPWHYHYYCRYAPYGYRHCACWPDY